MHIKRVLLVLFCGCAAATTVIAAQDEPIPLRSVTRPVMAGEVGCLPLFILTKFSGAATVIFAYPGPNGNTKGDAVLLGRTEVHISEGKPMFEKASEGGNGAIFRLSQSDYDKASACLPKPKSEPQATSQ